MEMKLTARSAPSPDYVLYPRSQIRAQPALGRTGSCRECLEADTRHQVSQRGTDDKEQGNLHLRAYISSLDNST